MSKYQNVIQILSSKNAVSHDITAILHEFDKHILKGKALHF